MTGKPHITGAVAAFIVLIAASGCASFSTYPPVEITGSMTKPSFEPIPTLMAESIHWAHERYGAGETDFAINLPEGVTYETYNRVIQKLGMGHPMTDPMEKAYHVLEVRVRGLEAEVDLIYPRPNSIYELVTIKLSRRLVEGWGVLSSRLWRIHVDVPGMNYVPPPPPDAPQDASPDASPDMPEPAPADAGTADEGTGAGG